MNVFFIYSIGGYQMFLKLLGATEEYIVIASSMRMCKCSF